jgi:hypothetical protein
MDTKFWGKDAWTFLHCIANNYPEIVKQSQKNNYFKFFNNLQHILPCIYCRQSLTAFYERIPMNTENNKEFNTWFFKIHNAVNNKLRKQGGQQTVNPRQGIINKYYSHYMSRSISDSKYPGWDFIYSICTNYPKHVSVNDPKYRYYRRFFSYLQEVIPYPAMKKEYKKYLQKKPIQAHLKTRAALIDWFYNFENSCQSCHEKMPTLTATKNKYEKYRAVCDNKLASCCRRSKNERG